jgi:hypothetical protein
METTEAVKIAKLNDSFRKSGQGITVTQGVQVLDDLIGLIDDIRHFDLFTKFNDPHEEHDFGIVYWMGEKVFWKIDYYDQSLRFGEDPLSSKCRRVLTIMLASEY